jgi:BolA protein
MNKGFIDLERIKRIEELLKTRFQPKELNVVDFSVEHKGHPGQAGGTETHIRVEIKAAEFADCSLLESHRRIQDTVKEEFSQGLHALEIKIL